MSQVELLSGGELAYGSARRLSDRGWGLHIEEDAAAEQALMMGQECVGLDGGEPVPGGTAGSAYPSREISTGLESKLEMIRLLAQGKLVEL